MKKLLAHPFLLAAIGLLAVLFIYLLVKKPATTPPAAPTVAPASPAAGAAVTTTGTPVATPPPATGTGSTDVTFNSLATSFSSELQGIYDSITA